MFDRNVASFEDDDGAYDQRDAEGFIRLNALRLRLARQVEAVRDFFAPGGRSPVFGVHAAAATSHPLASAEGIGVLRAGGSAADAAIAACAVQCVVEPHMTGVGGDCFVLVKTATEEAPGGFEWERSVCRRGFLWRWRGGRGGEVLAETSPLTVTVPGAVDAWWQLHSRFGRLPWRGLFQTAIRYASAGYPVTPRVATDWRTGQGRVALDEDAREVFLPAGVARGRGSGTDSRRWRGLWR